MKKILLFILLCFVSITNVNASTNTYDRTGENLGVNKDITITQNNRDNVLNTPLVNANEKVYDFANIYTDIEESQLYTNIQKYLTNTKMDMVVLVTDLPYSSAKLEEYAADFYDYNDFGLNLKNYSGILLHINMNTYNRMYNIYTFGDAMLYYNDYRLESMLDYMQNDMVARSFLSATMNFINNANYYYGQGIPEGNKNAYIDSSTGDIIYRFSPNFQGALIMSSIVTIILMLIFYGRNKMVKKATKATEYLDNNSVICNIRDDKFVSTRTTSYTRSSSSGSSYSGGGSRSRSSSSRGSSGRSHGGGSGRRF